MHPFETTWEINTLVSVLVGRLSGSFDLTFHKFSQGQLELLSTLDTNRNCVISSCASRGTLVCDRHGR